MYFRRTHILRRMAAVALPFAIIACEPPVTQGKPLKRLNVLGHPWAES